MIQESAVRILLVEDSVDDAELLGFALRDAPFPFTLERVDTEPAFAAALAPSPPDLILCDYHLPRFSMTRALQIVREERRLDMPFIVVSRLIGEDAAVDAMQRGANDYLLKGRLGRLPSAIQAAIERNRARREMARAEEALRRSDLLNRSLLNSLAMRIAVLDARGVVVAANRSWERTHREAPGGDGTPAVGDEWLARLATSEDGLGAPIHEGVRAVLERRQPRFGLEYEVAARGGPRWEMVRAEPLEDREDGAVVSVEDITPRMMTHLALHEAHRRLQQLSKRVLGVQEEERRAIALQLHDDVGQSLAAQKIALHGLAQRLAQAPDGPATRQCLDIADDVLEKLRRLSYALRPPQLDQLGLEAALQSLAESQSKATGLAIECRGSGLAERAPAVIELACFRIAQESLNNATRHAGATRIVIDAALKHRILRLTVRDDGHGFDPDEARSRAMQRGRLGLIGMAERAELAGGRLKVRSAAGSGTSITATFPLEGPMA